MTAPDGGGQVLRDRTARRWLLVVGVLALVGAGVWLVLARVDLGVSDRFAPDDVTVP